MKKGENYKGIVDAIDFPNKGILWIDGEKVIVKNVLPGQEIRFAVNKKQKGRIEGRLLEVLKKSPLEKTEGVCPHF